MKSVTFFVLITVATADRLEKLYLPANIASNSGETSAIFRTPNINSIKYQPLPLTGSQDIRKVPPVLILRLNNENNGDGKYTFEYETENQISHQESGIARSEEEPVIVSGSYSYKAPNGEILKVTYTADENGFQPQGEHLPVAPPVPEEILRALASNAADEAAGIYDDGQYRPDGSEVNLNQKKLTPHLKVNNGGYKY